jgi:hypothetical protein
VDDAGPGEEFVQSGSDLLVDYGIGMGEVDRRISEAGVVDGSPIEIAFAISSEAETLTPALAGQVEGIFLALEIERKEGFYPFGWVLRLSGIFWVGGRAPDFELLGEDGLAVVVEVE